VKLKNINDIKVICRNCGVPMTLESNMDNYESIFVCQGCKEHIILVSKGKKGVCV